MNRKRISAFFTIVMVLAVILSLSACDVQGLKKLDAPVVTVSETGLASWEAVEGAVGYKYKINNGFEKETVETSVQLQHNETIVVKAIGDGKKYSNSDYSIGKKYVASSSEKKTLPAPVVGVSEDGVATWNAVEGASGYAYKIDDGAEIRTNETSVTLENGQSVRVKAVGDGKEYSDSAYSSVVKYIEGQASCSHVDSDDDGRCDNCNLVIAVYLDLFAVNDLHGKIFDTSDQPGVDELTTYLKGYAANGNSVVLSSGDMWQGSSESNLTKGNMMTEWMNELNFVSMTLGNHEFDWGEEKISDNLAIADFPFLAINVRKRSTGEIADYCQPSVTVERCGVKIGIIGAIGNCYSSISASQVEDVYFITGSSLTNLVKAEAQKLRSEGADVIIYSWHDSYSNNEYDSVLSSYVDVVFEGHTHSRYVYKDGRGIYHLQNGAENEGISHAKVKIDCLTNKNSIVKAEIVPNSVYKTYAQDPIVNKLKTKYSEQIAMASRVVGYNDVQRSKNELRQTVAQKYIEKGLEKWGANYDIVLGGGYLSVRSPGYLEAGEITYSMLMSIMPFDNRLVLCTVSGSKLLSQFINTQNQNYFVAYSSYGDSVKNSVDESKTYYIITDTYSSDYAPNALTVVDYYDADVFARDLLAEFIEEGGYGSAPTDDYVLTTIPEALTIGGNLANNATSEYAYYVEGTVKNVVSETYGNLYIEDEDGNVLYVYGVYDASGTRYDGLSDKPKVGDKVVLKGKITNYYNAETGTNIIELKSAIIVKLGD